MDIKKLADALTADEIHQLVAHYCCGQAVLHYQDLIKDGDAGDKRHAKRSLKEVDSIADMAYQIWAEEFKGSNEDADLLRNAADEHVTR